MKRVNIAFGTEMCDKIMEHKWTDAAAEYGEVKKKDFATDAEKMAYLDGVYDAIGWDDYYILDKDEMKALSRHLKK